MLILGIFIFIVGCCMSTYEDTSYRNNRRAEARHRELIAELNRYREESREIAPKEERKARRRIAKDKDGNILAEEITEEIIR